jgi:soluble lytic murein transglycosylase-like protein
MQARTSRRRRPAPTERGTSLPRHPTGRARRRWPRAYDGGTPEEEPQPVGRRYRRAFAQERRRGAAQHARRRKGLDLLRHTPVRNGLVGLAVVGTAAPLAINRYQTALRADASHERISVNPSDERVSDHSLSAVWAQLEEAQNSEEAVRDQAIDEAIDRYADYRLDRDLAERIYDRAVEAEVDPEIAFGLIRAESSFRNQATSVVGAVGLTQLMPRTAAWLEPGITRTQLRDPDTNLRIGLKYLKQLTDKYNGNVDLALVAYNRGPGTVDRALKRGQNPDNGYAAFVKGEANHGHKLFTNR